MGETHLLEPKAHRLLAEIDLVVSHLLLVNSDENRRMLVLKCPRILRLVILGANLISRLVLYIVLCCGCCARLDRMLLVQTKSTHGLSHA